MRVIRTRTMAGSPRIRAERSDRRHGSRSHCSIVRQDGAAPAGLHLCQPARLVLRRRKGCLGVKRRRLWVETDCPPLRAAPRNDRVSRPVRRPRRSETSRGGSFLSALTRRQLQAIQPLTRGGRAQASILKRQTLERWLARMRRASCGRERTVASQIFWP